MKVLIVEPGKYPREADIEHTLEAEQAVVGGTIEAVYPWRDSACIVCNDNGIAENLPLNRMLGDYDIIHGTFFVCGLTRDDFTDLTPKQMKHYEEMYHDPQLFFLLGKTLCVEHTTLGAGDQGVMVGYACNETPEYLPMPVVAAQRLVTLLEISRMTGVIPDIGPDGKVQVTMEYNGDTPVRITTVVVSVQHKEDTDINKLADLLDEYVFPLAFDGMPADDAEIILNPSGKFVQGGPDADTGLTGRKLMVDTYGTFAPHGGGAFSGKDPTKVDRSGAYMARYIAKNIVATHLATRCQVTLAYAIGQAEPVMVDVNTFGTCDACEDDCLAAAVRKAYDLTPAGIIKQLNLTNPIYKYTAAGGHFGRKDFPWEKVDNMSDFISYIQ